ncbi:transposase [Dictyobacter kobayashii]|uniref:Transposase IS200-like domain-containing protein n=1 Tax=Dictyobacter kobayashii TaxID=2014872 RepID=A0A402AQH7_9CHLR|nr:transposase [Dictyobacter kobayashii]GCE21304.1 hypothetical protein KDK_51040 [Dictyobacter kobayashii]
MSKQKKPRRKSFKPLKQLGLPAHKYYLPGAYAFTICTHQRKALFNIPALRSILYEEWAKLPQHFNGIVPGTIMVMHDHLHCMLILKDGFVHTKSARQIIGSYKSIVARAWISYLDETGANYPGKIWQYRSYDHVVMSEADFKAQTAYILNNPAAYKAKQKKTIQADNRIKNIKF